LKLRGAEESSGEEQAALHTEFCYDVRRLEQADAAVRGLIQ
jgi:hypothetical protein